MKFERAKTYLSRRNLAAAIALLSLTAACTDSSTTSTGGGTTTTTTTAPGAPTIGTATAGDTTASISFTAPSSNGGSAITGYTATCTASGASKTGTGSSSPITVSGLTNGTTYSCTVTATNAVGTSAASGAVSVTPAAATASVSTSAVGCALSGSYTGSYSAAGTLTATWSWTCSNTRRLLTGNGLPNHAVGTFPNSGNPNTISTQTVSTSMTLTPTKASSNQTTGQNAIAYALNSVKFEPGTAGTCPSNATSTSSCNLANGTDTWRLEALGPNDGTRVFDFGTDTNNAHVQPTGVYHYHGMPEGLLTNAGITNTNRQMLLVGWAADGYPVYARYCYSSPNDATSALKVCTGSYSLVTTTATGRPSTTVAPLGWFTQDWNYSAGSGDLDDCNGRTGVTPEFPNGIYYYMVTDTYPYYGRCLKGNVN